METLKVLVLGTGFFGKNWLRELSACGDCEVAGLVGKHPELLATAGEEFGVPAARQFATIADGLDRAGAQTVVVALPEMVHKDAILAALGRGLHVLTEKPLAMTMAEAREIVRAARGLPASVVMVDQNYRWRPQTRTLRQAVRDGRIGRIGSIAYEYRQPITRTTTDAWREKMPHPFLHDMAPHHFDLLRACTGLECEQVMARGVRPAWNWYQGVPGVDAILSFERGVSATLRSCSARARAASSVARDTSAMAASTVARSAPSSVASRLRKRWRPVSSRRPYAVATAPASLRWE